MKKVVLVLLALFLLYPTFPGFSKCSREKAPECSVTIEGKGNTLVITTRCGKRIQYLMEEGRYKAWRFEGEVDWRPIPETPKIVIKSEDAA